MKRLLSVLLVAVLVMASLPVTAFAAGTASGTGSNEIGVRGETVSVSFTIEGDNFANGQFTASFNSDVLSLTENASGALANPANNKVTFYLPSNTNSYSFSVEFLVAENAPGGTYPVTLTPKFVSDEQAMEDLSVEAFSGTVIIEANDEPCQHAEKEWVVETEATCTAEGKENLICKACKEILDSRAIAKKAHSFVWTVTTEPTCGKPGVETEICSVCGAKGETREIPATGDHTMGGWVSNEDGTHVRWCSVCDYSEDGWCEDHKFEYKAADRNVHFWECELCRWQWQTGKNEDVPGPGPEDPNLDDVPRTDDITGQVVMTASAALICMVAAVAFIFKRKAAK